jgi:hypothetical protein
MPYNLRHKFESRLRNPDRVQLLPRNAKHPTTQFNMALPLQQGLTPTEVAFLCEMEMVTVVPRQRLESLNLLGVSTYPANPTISSPSLLLTLPFSPQDIFLSTETDFSILGTNTRSETTPPRCSPPLARSPSQTPTQSQHSPSTMAPPLLPRINSQNRNLNITRLLGPSTSTLFRKPYISSFPPLVNRLRAFARPPIPLARALRNPSRSLPRRYPLPRNSQAPPPRFTRNPRGEN